MESGEITQSDAKDLTAFFPRVDGAEMRTRFDIQVAPPDILITNYSMLSIMLMRDIDSGIFDKTKEWLECEDTYSCRFDSTSARDVSNLILNHSLSLKPKGFGSKIIDLLTQ